MPKQYARLGPEHVARNVRLPADLNKWLEQCAYTESRTMTAIIIRALQEYRSRQEETQFIPYRMQGQANTYDGTGITIDVAY